MSANPEPEDRALNAAELEMVKGTRPPAIEQQSKEDLKSLGRRLRQAHSRAHDISMRQQREMRGKAEPHGAHPATDATRLDRQDAGLVRSHPARRPGALSPRRDRDRKAEP